MWGCAGRIKMRRFGWEGDDVCRRVVMCGCEHGKE